MSLEIINLGYFAIPSVDMTVRKGECIGLSGPSGSGKSLFLRALADLDPHEGDVRLDTVSFCAHKPHEWRKKVSLLPAESQWWFDTVGEHFTDYDENILQKIGFDNDVMEWHVSRLSSGEKQRLALLRILVNEPKVLLLDEPTANLDPRFVGTVESLLADYKNKNKAALIWVSHDTDQLKRVADRRFEIRGQRIVEVSYD